MYAERLDEVESLEELEERRFEELLREEGGDSAFDRLIERMADREPPATEPEPFEIGRDEFVCRACRLIFRRSCLKDEARSLCTDCSAVAAADALRRHLIPHVDRVHRPCPACGALVMVPEREDVTCGFVCPSCRVHLSVWGGHLHLSWNHREVVREGGGGMNVLVVESDARLRELVASWVREAGFEVLSCPGPPEPKFDCAGAGRYGCPLAESAELIVLDLELESDLLECGAAAWELLHYYRSLDRPVVVLSGTEDAIRPLPGDRLAVLRRPPDRDALVEATRVLLLTKELPPAAAPEWVTDVRVPGGRASSVPSRAPR